MLDDLEHRELELSVRSGSDSNKKYDLDNSDDKMALGEFVSAITDGKELLEGQKILLAVTWYREDERRLFEMFPEVLMFDVTYQTNTEARPLGLAASIDHHMNVFTPFRVFMPSECQW